MNRGSEWRIWDLHVHTPFSLEHNYKCSHDEDIWEKYIDALEHLPDDIKVLGINDYLFIDGYRKVIDYKERGRLQNIDLILPVVEFRLSKFCGNEKFKRINYHIIFSNDLTPDQIQQQFLNALTANYTLSPDYKQLWNGVISRESIEELGKKIIASAPEAERQRYGSPLKEGFNNLNLESTIIEKALSNASHIFEGKYITAIGKTEWDDFKWNDNSIAEKKNIINRADIVFTAAESVEAYIKSKNKLHEQKVNELLLDCSDAHSFADQIELKDRLGNCKTWIKADTTFEGLKQILFEPEERVRIQDVKPDEKDIYKFIASIKLDEKGFWEGEIPLNSNLNTIIGGRSTGKSSLLKAIAAKHGSTDVPEKDFIRNHLEGVFIQWQDGGEIAGHEIEYFTQNYMHKIASEPEETNKLVISIIRSKKEGELLSSYKIGTEDISKRIRDSIYTLFKDQDDISSIKKDLLEKGNKAGVEEQLRQLKSKASELQKNSAMTVEESTIFEEQTRQVQEKRKLIVDAENDLSILTKLSEDIPFASSFTDKYPFIKLSFSKNQNDVEQYFNTLKQKYNDEWKRSLSGLMEATQIEKGKLSSEVQSIEKEDIYKKGLRVIEDNKELRDVNNKIKEEEEKLADINKQEQQLQQITNHQTEILQTVVDDHCSFKNKANGICDTLKISHDELGISVTTEFHSLEMQDFLQSKLNQRGNERKNYLQELLEEYNKNNKTHISNFLRELLSEDVLLKSWNNPRDVATDFFTRNWYGLNFCLSYQEDDFTQMSEGKQAFVILKLLLDFSDKKCPILIDQPEDSLDNRAIYNELVTYIKEKKRERQIILVSHNSNVVVSADAENIIVANQEGVNNKNENGVKFQYTNGALENTKQRDETSAYILSSQGIREHICDILEGGRVAFEKREQKYGFRR